MKRLANKIAFVTGGSRGMGAAIVTKLAREGATVIFTYVKGAAAAKTLIAALQEEGLDVASRPADSADPVSLVNTINEVAATYGRIDILVNNAGIYVAKAFEDYTLEDYEATMAINTRAVFVGTQAALRHMPEGGRVITIGSCMADRVVGSHGTLYSMSKSALTAFNKGLARDLGSRGITTNLVQPGPVDTDMNPADGPFSDFQRQHIALGHYGTAKDIAELVAFLAGPDSGYITGTALTIDGGTNS
ncbi:3-oxoacyl-[acyl-carrier protein] reductase [Chitinophaga terrae (ex Kim and Jung 2007)]|uniref:SDR family oxidoreductase n=1 Tax=Chitinophaga terrae (ex Kim and Jung 2007) TaxID=408074 RepID=UPI0027899B32|nr:SDR family oxidoreductase [Chitinophaga terrae (ex Kim and Jung 2007)]MDQ0110176.1 3-oxoacyl-[acyl-carrier protein] reductase [Chitinophaga terrae (ex Kim and Jung 2007)]